jgi:hypothetical protein
MEAFQSCLAAEVKNLIITSSGEDAELALVHNRIRKIKPDTVITAIKEDKGNNEAWLRGAKLVTTPWTYILHDDDRVLPRFKLLEKDLNSNVGFYHWNCIAHGPNATKYGLPFVSYFPNLITGVYSSAKLLKVAADTNIESISPVSGLFKTDHVVETLAECDKNFGRDFIWHKTMMIGNDLMLWLRAAEKYRNFKFYAEPMASYGYWDGSTTLIASQEHVLLPLYNKVRNYWLIDRYAPNRRTAT